MVNIGDTVMKNCKIFLLSFLISLATIMCYADQPKTLLIFGAKWCKFCSSAKEDISKNRDRKSTRLNSSHVSESRMPSSA